MWFIKSRYVTNNILEEFFGEYGNVPGILDVQDDGIRRDAIIVFYDNKLLPKHSLPRQFYGHPLHLYDVRQMLGNVKRVVARIKVSKDIDLTDKENQKIYARFVYTGQLCEALLRKQKETSSEVSATA